MYGKNLDINKDSNPNEARATQRDWCFFSGHSFASGSISMDAIYSSVWFCLQRQMYSYLLYFELFFFFSQLRTWGLIIVQWGCWYLFIFQGWSRNEEPLIFTVTKRLAQNGTSIEIISLAFLAIHTQHRRNTAQLFMIFCLLSIFLVVMNQVKMNVLHSLWKSF